MATRPWASEIREVPSVGDETIETFSETKCRFDSSVREIMFREKCGLAAFLSLPRSGPIRPDAA
jgi:hypothetical protein